MNISGPPAFLIPAVPRSHTTFTKSNILNVSPSIRQEITDSRMATGHDAGKMTLIASFLPKADRSVSPVFQVRSVFPDVSEPR